MIGFIDTVFTVCSVYFIVLCAVLFSVMCVICVLCLIVLPLPPGKNPFAVKLTHLHFTVTHTH
jgi:hypothetical protein